MREELDELKRTIYVLKLESGFNAKALFVALFMVATSLIRKLQLLLYDSIM